ncbi:MAG: hypothetical protein Q8L26_09290 [Candidatus Omnitrophota bacterium]|nr:hypothetical protein [Candidatus Omnitrophota bacterium]
MDVLEALVLPVSIITAAMGFILGMIFIFKPAALQKLSEALNKKFFVLEKIQQALDKEVQSDDWLARKSKMIGIIVVILALVIMLQIIVR